MEFVKLLKDYSKTPIEASLNDYLSNQLDSVICHEPIKNKEFMIKYIMPVNDLLIYTTALPFSGAKRILY